MDGPEFVDHLNDQQVVGCMLLFKFSKNGQHAYCLDVHTYLLITLSSSSLISDSSKTLNNNNKNAITDRNAYPSKNRQLRTTHLRTNQHLMTAGKTTDSWRKRWVYHQAHKTRECVDKFCCYNDRFTPSPTC